MPDLNDVYLQQIASQLQCHRAHILETIEQMQTRIEELQEFEFIYKGEQK